MSSTDDLELSQEAVVSADDSKSEGMKRGLSHSDSPDEANKKQFFDFKINSLKESISSAVGDEDPVYVPLLFKVLDVISSKMDVVIDKNNILEQKLIEQSKIIDEQDAKIANQDAKILQHQKQIAELTDKSTKMEEMLVKVALTVDKNEQHSRNECLLLHGIKEEQSESANSCKVKFVEKVKAVTGIEIKPSDIKRAHRFGGKSQGKTRPIIARFNRPEMRNDVYRNKRKFKGQKNADGKSVSVTENLTPLRLRLLNEARDTYGRGNVWTVEGRLYACEGDNKITLPIKL